MNKNLKGYKIIIVAELVLILLFIIFFAYVSHINYSNIIEFFIIDMFYIEIEYTLLPMAIIVAIIAMLYIFSLLALKFKIKKEIDSSYKKVDLENKRRMEKKKNKIFIWLMILTIIGHGYFYFQFRFNIFWFWIIILGVIISAITRLNKNKKISSIILTAFIIFSCSIVYSNYIKEINKDNFNRQFSEYMTRTESYIYTERIEDLLNTLIENNQNSKRKITLIYNNKNYMSVNEIKLVLDNINKNKYYSVRTNFENQYIESIEISKFYSYLLSEVKDYDKSNVASYVVTSVLSRIDSQISYKYLYSIKYRPLYIIYKENDEAIKEIEINSTNNKEKIDEINNLIQKPNKYTLDMTSGSDYDMIEIILENNI